MHPMGTWPALSRFCEGGRKKSCFFALSVSTRWLFCPEDVHKVEGESSINRLDLISPLTPIKTQKSIRHPIYSRSLSLANPAWRVFACLYTINLTLYMNGPHTRSHTGHNCIRLMVRLGNHITLTLELTPAPWARMIRPAEQNAATLLRAAPGVLWERAQRN